MKVAELLSRLANAEPDAAVLLLPRHANYTEAEELREVALFEELWICQQHRDVNGTRTEVHYPDDGHGYPLGWDPATDEIWRERVVILSPRSGVTESQIRRDEEPASGSFSVEGLRAQALQVGRKMVADGQLLPAHEFRTRLGISERRFGHMLEDGSIFSLDVDGTDYFPALLADPRLNQKRLQAICRIIVPAPPVSRLDFFWSRLGSLGDRSPLHMLGNDGDYMRLEKVAEAWAAEYSRTTVRLYDGEHESEPIGIEPIYTATIEVDPRKPLWERASKALHIHGYEWPLGPYPEFRTHTIFVARQSAGYTQPVPEACVQVLAKDDFVRVRIVYESGKAREPRSTPPVAKGISVVDVAKKVVARLLRR